MAPRNDKEHVDMDVGEAIAQVRTHLQALYTDAVESDEERDDGWIAKQSEEVRVIFAALSGKPRAFLTDEWLSEEWSFAKFSAGERTDEEMSDEINKHNTSRAARGCPVYAVQMARWMRMAKARQAKDARDEKVAGAAPSTSSNHKEVVAKPPPAPKPKPKPSTTAKSPPAGSYSESSSSSSPASASQVPSRSRPPHKSSQRKPPPPLPTKTNPAERRRERDLEREREREADARPSQRRKETVFTDEDTDADADRLAEDDSDDDSIQPGGAKKRRRVVRAGKGRKGTKSVQPAWLAHDDGSPVEDGEEGACAVTHFTAELLIYGKNFFLSQRSWGEADIQEIIGMANSGKGLEVLGWSRTKHAGFFSELRKKLMSSRNTFQNGCLNAASQTARDFLRRPAGKQWLLNNNTYFTNSDGHQTANLPPCSLLEDFESVDNAKRIYQHVGHGTDWSVVFGPPDEPENGEVPNNFAARAINGALFFLRFEIWHQRKSFDENGKYLNDTSSAREATILAGAMEAGDAESVLISKLSPPDKIHFPLPSANNTRYKRKVRFEEDDTNGPNRKKVFDPALGKMVHPPL